MTDNSIYLKEVLDQTPRLLGLLDRNVSSQTGGCFDRQYWHYNTSDFASARSQEAVLTLALLYKINKKNNIYYNKKLILDWINAGLEFWAQIQEPNGSFNEWYPKEHSFVATAFSTYAISEAVLLLGEKIREKETILSSLQKAGDWILNKNEKRVQNQESGAAIALYNLYLLTGEKKYKKSAKEKIKFIINNQTKEGWFYEYRGADIGYLSLCVDYLSKYYKKTSDTNLLNTLNKAINFLSYFIHPNETFGGEYGSRNTEYMIPHGFEIMSEEIPAAKTISSFIRNALHHRSSISLSSMDDRYLSYISYTYLQAYLDSNDKISAEESETPFKKNFVKEFTEAGLWIYSDANLYLISNYKKGGAFKAFFKTNNAPLYDSGIVIETIDGKKLTSCWLTNKISANIIENCLIVEGNLWEISSSVLSPTKNILLRLFQMALGRNEKISLIVKEKLRDKLITNANICQDEFIRKIIISRDTFEIVDTINISNSNDINRLFIGPKISLIYTPSSRYFQVSEIDNNSIIYEKTDLSINDNIHTIEVYRRYDLLGNLVKICLNTIKKSNVF
jgi:hypothetical protein